jgi:hypothetical protein
MIITRERNFKMGMGNFETHTEGMAVTLDLEKEGLTFEQGISEADRRLRTGLEVSLKRAADISEVANTYVLTWLEEDNA